MATDSEGYDLKSGDLVKEIAQGVGIFLFLSVEFADSPWICRTGNHVRVVCCTCGDPSMPFSIIATLLRMEVSLSRMREIWGLWHREVANSLQTCQK